MSHRPSPLTTVQVRPRSGDGAQPEDQEPQAEPREGQEEGAGRQEEQGQQQGPGLLDQWRALLAEVIGTFAITFAAAAGEVVAALSHGEVSYAARVVPYGLAMMVMVFSLADISGAHFNPVVSLAFALRRALPWRRVPTYWLAQVTGAVLAALLLRALFGLQGDLGVTEPRHGIVPALAMEMVLTFLYVMVVLGASTGHRLVGANAAIAIGGAIMLGALIGNPISGASMNPAHSLGPALVSGRLADFWIYLVGPFVGAVIAVGCMWYMRGGPPEGETAKATGEGHSGE